MPTSLPLVRFASYASMRTRFLPCPLGSPTGHWGSSTGPADAGKGGRHQHSFSCTPDSLTAWLVPSNLWVPGDAQCSGQGWVSVVNQGSGFPWALLEARVTRGGAGEGGGTYINGAAKERAFLQSLLDDPEQVGRGLPQLIPLSDASGEVLEALSGGAT